MNQDMESPSTYPGALGMLGALTLVSLLTACGGGGGGTGSPTIPPVGTSTPTPLQTPAPAAASGTVTDDAATPLSGVTVSLAPFQTPPPSGAPEPTPAPAIATTTTSSTGAYSFSNVPTGTYLLSEVPQDASAVYSQPPSPFPPAPAAPNDPANSGMGAYTATHATLHRKVTLTGASNALGTDQILRLTDNEVVCAQVFEQGRRGAGVPTLPIDSAAQAMARGNVAAEATANGGTFTGVLYSGVGEAQAGDYHSGIGCVTLADPLPSDTLSPSLTFVGMTTLNPTGTFGGDFSGIAPAAYP